MSLGRVFTLGYDALGVKELANSAFHYSIEVVVDVRRWNGSVGMPHYSVINLHREFERIGVDYVWIPELGGYRSFGTELVDVSIGKCFRSKGFRAYATHILTSSEARSALKRLLKTCTYKTAFLLCCERSPYPCHRKIPSD